MLLRRLAAFSRTCNTGSSAAMKRRASQRTAAAAVAGAATPTPEPTASKRRTRKQQQQQKQPKAAPTSTKRQQKPAVAAVPAASAGAADAGDRCPWATTYAGSGSAAYVAYHDEEWGRPTRDDTALFELLVLEGAQAGLSWATILGKRPAYRAAFAGFDASKVAAYTDADVERLLAPDSGVVRHAGKLRAAVTNARVVLELAAAHGSFAAFVWSFVPGGRPIVNAWTSMAQMPTKSPESEALSAALKTAGASFVGPTTMYAFMQAAGLVNDHVVGCRCRQAIIDAEAKRAAAGGRSS